jgi:hypothetical protein
VSGIFLPLRVKSLPLATIYEVKIPLRKWKKSLLQRNPAQMTSAIVWSMFEFYPRQQLLKKVFYWQSRVHNIYVAPYI